MIDIVGSNTGTALLVTADATLTHQLVEAMGRFALCTEISSNVSAALYLVMHRKFEAIMIDFLLAPQAATFHGQLRASASNRTSITFALTSSSDENAEAFKSGFSFALERPLTEESIERTLKVAFGMIVRERRRSFRFPITVPAVVTPKGTAETVFGQTVNVSERGMALKTPSPLIAGTRLTAEFTLPDGKPLAIRAESKVCWESGEGYSGLSFLTMPSNGSEFQAWLAQKLEAQLPIQVTRKFSPSS